jgi:hypothetical protein
MAVESPLARVNYQPVEDQREPAMASIPGSDRAWSTAERRALIQRVTIM